MPEQSAPITFLIATGPLALDKDAFVFSTLQQAYQNSGIIGCLSPDSDYCEYLDDWLWTYKPQYFLPHTCLQSPSKTHQIYIHHELQALENCTQVLNLTQRALTHFLPNCTHLELVHEHNKQQQRQTFKDYQHAGIQPLTRKIH